MPEFKITFVLGPIETVTVDAPDAEQPVENLMARLSLENGVLLEIDRGKYFRILWVELDQPDPS